MAIAPPSLGWIPAKASPICAISRGVSPYGHGVPLVADAASVEQNE
jgi:hypothetical protein